MLPFTFEPKAVRTDFSDDASWQTVSEALLAPQTPDEFRAALELIDDVEFIGASVDDLLALLQPEDETPFLIIADATTMSSVDRLVRVVDLAGNRGQTFLALPATVQAIENNLSIGNMTFAEFASACDANGVFRGF